MTKTIKCVICCEHKEQEGFGKKQWKSTNLSPTCLKCAANCRYAEWASQYDDPGGLGDGSGPRRACKYCKELKGRSAYTKKEWKSDANPVCSECQETYGHLEWALGGIPREDMLLRSHTTEELDLLLRFKFLTWEEVTTFLASRSDEAYAQKHGFYPGLAHDGVQYSATSWLMHYARNYPGDHFIKSLVAGIASDLNLVPGMALWHFPPLRP